MLFSLVQESFVISFFHDIAVLWVDCDPLFSVKFVFVAKTERVSLYGKAVSPPTPLLSAAVMPAV